MTDAAPKFTPVALRSDEERYAHVARRLAERGGISWDPVRVATLEKKIKFVRAQMNLRKIVPLVLPTKIGEDKDGHVHYYRVMIANAPHTFVWSQICRGVISYRGPGEITTPHTPAPAPTPGQDPKAGIVLGASRFRDLSGCDPV